MKKIGFLLLALFPLLAGCAFWGTKDEYRVTPRMFRLEDLFEDLDRAKSPKEARASEETVKTSASRNWAGKYLLKVNTLSGGDNYMAGNCDESALVDVDKDRKIIDVKAFPSSTKTCGNEESLKTTFWGKVVPAGLLASGYVGGSAVLGMSFPKPQGDRIDLSNDSSSKSDAEAEGGKGGHGGQGGQGGVANAQGGKSVIEKGAVTQAQVQSAKTGDIKSGDVSVTQKTGEIEVKANLESKSGPVSITASPTATASPSQSAGISNYSPSSASSGSSSFSSSKSDGAKIIGSGNSNPVVNNNPNISVKPEIEVEVKPVINASPPCSWCGHGHKD